MHRFKVEPGSIQDGCVTLTGKDLKHLGQVLRLGAGDKIRVFDGSGMEYEAKLVSINREKATAEIEDSFRPGTEPGIRVTLFQGLPKGEKMDLIVQKTVELGIYRIIPVITQRSVVRPDNKDRAKKAQRWSKIAKEASRQCGRAYVPSVLAPLDFNEAFNLLGGYGSVLLLYENERKKCLKEVLKCYTINKINDIALFVGPEGGFSDGEVEKFLNLGYDVAGLGKRILRTETAAISVLSVIMYEMDEFQ